MHYIVQTEAIGKQLQVLQVSLTSVGILIHFIEIVCLKTNMSVFYMSKDNRGWTLVLEKWKIMEWYFDNKRRLNSS